jgi:hypothetical protein
MKQKFFFCEKYKSGNGTSFGAHLGGAITGLTVGLMFLVNFHDETYYEKPIKWVGVALFSSFVTFSGNGQK